MQSYISSIHDTSTPCGCMSTSSKTSECLDIRRDVRTLEQDGYVVLRNVFSRNQCQHAIKSLEHIHASTDPDEMSPVFAYGCQHVDALLYRDLDTFLPFATNARVVSLLNHVAEDRGASFHLASLTARSAFPGCGEQALHEDYHVEDVAFAFNAVIMLDDFTEANGATQLVPGSHRHMMFLNGLDDGGEPVLVTGSVGDVLLFDAAIFHGGTRNRTESTRHALLGCYCSRNSIQFNACRHLKPGSYRRIATLTPPIVGMDCEAAHIPSATKNTMALRCPHPHVSLIDHEEIDMDSHTSQTDCKYIIYSGRRLV